MTSLWTVIHRLLKNRRGNIALSFAMLFVPVTIAVGISLDFVRAYNARVRLQNSLDAALIAAVKQASNKSDTNAVKAGVVNWLNAQQAEEESTYDITSNDIVVDTSKNTIVATARASLPTTILTLANIRTLNVAVSSSVVGPLNSYLNVYIVLDKSASMLLAATPSGQTAMRNSQAGCVFGCHIVEGGPWTYNGRSYSTNYALSKAMGVTLRADLSVTAAKEVLSLISIADPTRSHIRVGLYTMGGTLTEVVAPTFSVSTAVSALNDDTKKLTSATSETTSRFDGTVASLTSKVGNAGNGATSNTPMKLVLLLTDGAVSQRDWVLNGVWWDGGGKMHGGSDWYKVAPLNPNWCSTMKANKATVGILYTEYLSIPWDEGYLHTLGDTMKSVDWPQTWGGTMDSGVPNTIARRDYLPYALKSCATSAEMFIAASSATDIEKGLSSLFKVYSGNVRLTE